MDTMYIPAEEAYNGQRTIDVTKLVFQYTYMDIQAAAHCQGQNRKDFIKKDTIAIYPDTTVWIKDFNYSYNEPMHNDYFWHEAYGDYPVVGVSGNKPKLFVLGGLCQKAHYQNRNRPYVNSFDFLVKPVEYTWPREVWNLQPSWGGPYAKTTVVVLWPI